MVDFSKKVDVERWLAGKSHDDAVVFAARAALRVAPLLVTALGLGPRGGGPSRVSENLILPAFRALAAAWVVGQYPDRYADARASSQAAAHAADAAADAYARGAAGSAAKAAAYAALPVPGVGRARWRFELVRCRGRESAEFEVEACDAKGHLALPSELARRPILAARARM
jgi:hypothetical protein